MVLPEPSRKMAYTTRNTVNRLARKVNPVVLELSKEKEAYKKKTQKQKLDRIMQEKHENFSVQAYSFLEVKLRRLER